MNLSYCFSTFYFTFSFFFLTPLFPLLISCSFFFTPLFGCVKPARKVEGDLNYFEGSGSLGLFSASDTLRFPSFPSLSGQKEPVGQSEAVVPRPLREAAKPPKKLSASLATCTDTDDVCNRNWKRMLLVHCWNNMTRPSKLQIIVLCAVAEQSQGW